MKKNTHPKFQPKKLKAKYAFNSLQDFLYRRAMYGLSIYTPYELQDMHPSSRKKIEFLHKKTELALNTWKHDIVNDLTVGFFTKLFPKCDYVSILRKPTKPDPYFRNKITFNELNISKDLIADRMMKIGSLPKNFYEIKGDSLETLTSIKQLNY